MISFRSKKTAAAHDGASQEIFLNINNRTLLRILLLTFGMSVVFVGFLAALHATAHALMLIFTAFFLALALNAPVHWVAQHLPGKRRGNRSLATILSVLFVLLLLVGFLASIVPPFVRQASSLVDAAPGFVQDIRNQDSEIGRLVQKYHLQSQVDSFSSELSTRLKSASGAAVDVITQVGSSTFAILTILVLTFMMLVEGPHWVRLVEEMIPDRNRNRVRGLARAMYKVVKGYVNGQVLLAAVAALLIAPMLFILHISYPIALVAVVFICGLIPMVGHTLGAIIVTAVALFRSPLTAVIILGYYILYQQIENYLVQPKIQSNSTNMSPLLVFMAVVIGVNFGGLLGGLVAIPVMGCIRILVLDQLTRRNILDSPGHKKAVRKAEAPLDGGDDAAVPTKG